MDAECDELRERSINEPDPIRIEYDGNHGMFFTMTTSRYMLCQIMSLEMLSRYVRLSDGVTTRLRNNIDLIQHQLDITIDAKNTLGDIVDDAEQRANTYEAKVNAWYRSPFLWFAVGVVISVGLYFAAFYGLRSLNPI
jgi:hypothetical protein